MYEPCEVRSEYEDLNEALLFVYNEAVAGRRACLGVSRAQR